MGQVNVYLIAVMERLLELSFVMIFQLPSKVVMMIVQVNCQDGSVSIILELVFVLKLVEMALRFIQKLAMMAT